LSHGENSLEIRLMKTAPHSPAEMSEESEFQCRSPETTQPVKQPCARGSGFSKKSGIGSMLIAMAQPVFHRPRSHKESDKGAVQFMRQFLAEAGAMPC